MVAKENVACRDFVGGGTLGWELGIEMVAGYPVENTSLWDAPTRVTSR